MNCDVFNLNLESYLMLMI